MWKTHFVAEQKKIFDLARKLETKREKAEAEYRKLLQEREIEREKKLKEERQLLKAENEQRSKLKQKHISHHNH